MLEMTEKKGRKVLGAGYPAVERLIDSEDFGRVNSVFEAAYRQLSLINRKKKGLKKGRDAERAMASIEHVMNLFKELLEVKYRLQEMLAEAERSRKKR